MEPGACARVGRVRCRRLSRVRRPGLRRWCIIISKACLLNLLRGPQLTAYTALIKGIRACKVSALRMSTVHSMPHFSRRSQTNALSLSKSRPQFEHHSGKKTRMQDTTMSPSYSTSTCSARRRTSARWNASSWLQALASLTSG